MNRKQRFFADVNRLMGHGRRRWNGGTQEGAKGGAGLLEKPFEVEVDGKKHTVELSKPARLREEHIAEDLAVELEKLRWGALEALRGKGQADAAQVMELFRADVDALLTEHKTVLKEYRDHMRQIPEPDPLKLKASAFEVVRLSYDPRAEAKARADADKSTPASNAYLGKMSLAQFNLTCRTSRDLGLDDERAIRHHQRFQDLHNVLALQALYVAKTDPMAFQRGGFEQFREFGEYQALAKELGQAVHATRLGNAVNETNADEGANWVPGPILAPRIDPKIEEEYRLVGQFETVNMTAKTQDSGVLGAHKTSYKMPENVADDGTTAGASFTPSLFVTKKWRLDAKGHGAAAVATPFWLQDAIAGAAEILADLQFAMAAGREKWLLNGQLTSALDGVTIGTYDIRKMGDGLRYWISQIATANPSMVPVDLSAGITAENLVSIFGQQGSYGNVPQRAIWVANTFAIAQLLVLKTKGGQTVVLTLNELGPQATFKTGSIGQAFGRDIIPTNELSQTMDVSGLEPAVAEDRTILMHVRTDAVKHGVRLGTQVAMSQDARFFQNQEAFRAFARDDFAWVYDPTVLGNTFAWQGVGLKRIAA